MNKVSRRTAGFVTGLMTGLGRAASAASGHAAAIGYLAGWRLLRLLPERVARRIFLQVADRVYRRNGKAVQRLRANLARVRPDAGNADLDGLTREGVRSYLRYWCESFRLPSWPIEDLVRRTRTVDEDILRQAYARGNGVVVALPHMGNWDWAGAWACATGMPLSTVVERLKPERLYDEFVAYRRSLGMEILPLTGPADSSGGTFGRLVDWAASGGLVCLLADRDLSRTSVQVDLCGERARLPRGPALLARRTGAPLIPATLTYVGNDMEITFHTEIPHAEGKEGLAAMMQEVADAFTGALRENPQDWHMMQKVFDADLSPARG
ncbi:MAG: phosphatidylinositol mannoside acyltransferase [Actinomycetota bacterium]|nr:phosphatidylinositol mannoside acyltransferase [Actinomycetota bacterium]